MTCKTLIFNHLWNRGILGGLYGVPRRRSRN